MESVNKFFDGVSTYLIQQVKEWAEILVDFETKNKYKKIYIELFIQNSMKKIL